MTDQLDIGTPSEPMRSLHVRGVGRDSRRPDLALVTVGAETREATVGAAMSANNDATVAMAAVLRAHGIDPGDVQTSQITVQADHDRQSGRRIGYVVSNQLTVKIRSLDAIGPVLDAVASAAGDSLRINGLSFDLDDRSDAERAARAAAVFDARDQAEQLAVAAGVALGPLMTISTVSVMSGGFTPRLNSARAMTMESMPVEGGTIDVAVEVDLVYSISSLR